MKEQPLEKIIFSIDNVENAQVLGKFLYKMSQEKALGNMDAITPLIGKYEGRLEYSFMANSKDLEKILPYMGNQETVLLVPGDVRQPCFLWYLGTTRQDKLGPMKEVSWVEASALDAYSYVLETGKYYAC